jgi:hypothetical protein
MQRTLQSGIYYERSPAMPLTRALYDELARYIAGLRQQQVARHDVQPLKDSQVFPLLVFLVRLGELSINGRPRSRAFLDYLRQQFPAPISASSADLRENARASSGAASRIIIP